MLLVDSRTCYSDDRTWSFWSGASHDLRHLVRHEWRQWRFGHGDVAHDHEVPGITYQAIRGIDFYNDAQETIARSRAVALGLGVTVTGIRSVEPDADGNRLAVDTNDGVILARHVIDTRASLSPALLYQCFAGSEIDHGGRLRCSPHLAGLMTRMRTDDLGFAFLYVLPFSERSALVEFTRFSPYPIALATIAAERDAELRALGLEGAYARRNESGILPMGQVGQPRTLPEGLVLAGNGGGALRASTGYAFVRIQHWAAGCATRLARGEAPMGHARDGVIQRQLDRIFLQVLRAAPKRAPECFMALASGVAPHRLLRFLTDRATLLDLVATISSLPLTPFLAQLLHRHAIVADARYTGPADAHGATFELRSMQPVDVP